MNIYCTDDAPRELHTLFIQFSQQSHEADKICCADESTGSEREQRDQGWPGRWQESGWNLDVSSFFIRSLAILMYQKAQFSQQKIFEVKGIKLFNKNFLWSQDTTLAKYVKLVNNIFIQRYKLIFPSRLEFCTQQLSLMMMIIKDYVAFINFHSNCHNC